MFSGVQGTRFKTETLVELSNELSDRNIPRDEGRSSILPAGFTYLGQFIDHDITRMKRLTEIPTDGPVDVNKLVQERTPSLDLDSLYGGGLNSRSVPYTDDGKFYSEYVCSDGLIYDLPRGVVSGDYKARVGDSRNDENFLVAQMHVLFMNLHNKLIDAHYEESPFENFESVGVDSSVFNTGDRNLPSVDAQINARKSIREKVFAAVRKEVTLLYQLAIVNDFLDRLLDETVKDHLFPVESLPTSRLMEQISGEDIQLPIEFSGAAFRFGHSLVKSGYFLNPGLSKTSLRKLFALTSRGDLASQHARFEHRVDWAKFFEIRNVGNFNHASKLRPVVVSALREMVNEMPGNQNLLTRNLLRGKELDLPCAQDIVRHIESQHHAYADAVGLVEITERELASYKGVGKLLQRRGLEKKTPLWIYILMEPYYRGGISANPECSRLGKLGSIIVGETFRSLLEASATSIYDTGIEWAKLRVFSKSKELDESSSSWKARVDMKFIVNIVND